MKRFLVVCILVLAAATLVTAQAKKGPIIDKVYFDVRMDESIAMKDTAEGKTDAFYWGVTAATYNALPAETKAKLDVINVPSGSWSLMVNPIPNKAPYTVKVGDKTYFNPLAIREVRFALNFLINRKKIVDEILGGGGSVAYTPATTGQPGTYKYNLVIAKFGFTPTGNEAKAIKDINDALTKASELAELKGKLVKKGQFWEYDGEPCTVKFMIRVDDPNGRLKEGRYIADQIEKAGIKVERLEWDRSKTNALCYGDDPAKYDWTLYTEGWGAGATRAWWAVSTAQMYAPWFGYMAGVAEPSFWNYKNDEIDKLTMVDYNGLFLTADEYWANEIRATELGIQDAARIYVANQAQYYVMNKARFAGRPAYGLGDGINEWSTRTTDVVPEKDGTKILRVTQFSAKGSLFMKPWDPVGNAMNDVYIGYIYSPCTERASFESPSSALDTALRTTWRDVTTNIKKSKDKDGNDILVGQIAVPESAIMYDSAAKAFKPVGKGVVSFSKATVAYKWGVWHTGRPMSISDTMYALSFVKEWITKDGEGDKYYDASYEAGQRPGYETLKGVVLNADGTTTVYFDFNFPMDKNRIGATGAAFVYPATISASGQNVMVSWEINEALAKLVAEGGKSGTAWSFATDPAFVEVDVTVPKCLEDIQAKLQGFIDAKYVPPQIKRWKSVDEAVKDYQAAIKFIDEHKNAYISNGPFYINAVDLKANFIELAAFRNAAYPYEAGFWNTVFKSQTTRVDGVTVPATVSKDKDALVDVAVSIVEYPAGTAKSADATAKIRATLVLANGSEKAYKGTFVKTGQFQVKIPVADLKSLKAGSYTLVIETYLKNEAPATEVTTIVVF